jgi:TRAP-type uncharacterized transport system substrate-binding protein
MGNVTRPRTAPKRNVEAIEKKLSNIVRAKTQLLAQVKNMHNAHKNLSKKKNLNEGEFMTFHVGIPRAANEIKIRLAALDRMAEQLIRHLT